MYVLADSHFASFVGVEHVRLPCIRVTRPTVNPTVGRSDALAPDDVTQNQN